jgi:hypothetical protein
LISGSNSYIRDEDLKEVVLHAKVRKRDCGGDEEKEMRESKERKRSEEGRSMLESSLQH